ncbi:hypothetical protein BDU57DRAFT_458790 [Ampelomyces quisqualis]|uniref:Survival protein SurE-like phosphatase/nucleotidase domain-containing protein n=1 Tax=Ampelomyces quisqualis TaxID=50730 RepID=A0A6A5QD27_AMPQU|nr:hypothetical protein BDU57DRAFT_458790 [Ampelomyces quisqualis]
MRPYLLLTAVLPLTQGIRIVQTHYNGWAEANLRTLFNVLSNSGHQVVLSAPALAYDSNRIFDEELEIVKDGCVHNSCPEGSPPIGANATDPRLNYVNSYTQVAVRYGIRAMGPRLWHGKKPELVLLGPDFFNALGFFQYFSPSMRAAMSVATNEGIPAIVFDGATGSPTPWHDPTPLHSKIYAELAADITSTIIRSGRPLLPPSTIIYVNFPSVTDRRCNDTSQFRYILTRNEALEINDDVGAFWCDATNFPFDTDVIARQNECFVAISPGDAIDAAESLAMSVQEEFINKLRPILSCLPEI